MQCRSVGACAHPQLGDKHVQVTHQAQLRDDHRAALGHKHFVVFDDVWVAQARQHARLLLPPRVRLRHGQRALQ